MAKQEQPKIYYRPLKKWIEVTHEEKQNWERFIGTHRRANQRTGACCIPLEKSYRCDCICENCEFRCVPEDTPNVLSIESELERIYEGKSTYKGFISDEALTTEIDVDLMILRRLLAELKETDPESYQILQLCAEGLPERVCAERMNLPRNTFVYKRDKLLKNLKKIF